MRIALVLAAGLLLGSTSLPAESPSTKTTGKRCIVKEALAGPVVRDDGRVYFRGQPNSHLSYLAVFKGGRCPGLNRFAAVSIETSGPNYCAGDKLRSLNPPSTLPGPICVIDHFQPFDGEVDDPVD